MSNLLKTIVKKVKAYFLANSKIFRKINEKWFANLKSNECRFLLYDTETIHSTKKIPYKKEYTPIKDIIEISYIILKKNGKKVYKTEKSFIVKEFWEDKKYLHSKNYLYLPNENGVCEWKKTQNFAINKIPKWKNAIKNGTSVVKKWSDILKEIAYDLEYYEINLITAYNIVFDRQAIVSTNQIITERYYNKEKQNNYFYIGNFWQIPFIDIYHVIERIATTPDFIEWANAHKEFVYNNRGNIRLTAQVLYQFCVRFKNELMSNIELDSINWCESHIAIEDIDCEATILEYAITELEDAIFEIDKYGNALRANKKIKEVSVKNKVEQLELFK